MCECRTCARLNSTIRRRSSLKPNVYAHPGKKPGAHAFGYGLHSAQSFHATTRIAGDVSSAMLDLAMGGNTPPEIPFTTPTFTELRRRNRAERSPLHPRFGSVHEAALTRRLFRLLKGAGPVIAAA